MDFSAYLQQFVSFYAEQWQDTAVKEIEEQDFTRVIVSSPTLLRDSAGNHPQILHHGEMTDNVIVLLHGLTDSPYYMSAIAQDFAQIGFTVVLLLLPAHGLRRPGRAFHNLQHTQWIETVDVMCKLASQLGNKVSIGGLSTGGTLCVHKAVKAPEAITGGLFLFSAALDIGTVEQLVLQTEAGRMIARLRDQQLWLAKTIKEQIQMILDDQEEGRANEYFGIGDNEYKYSVFFFEGASQLAEVIQEINQHYDSREQQFSDLTLPIFVAHAQDDDSALYRGVTRLVEHHPNDAIALYTMTGVPHGSVVLKSPIIDDAEHSEYAPANPCYADMSERMLAFAREQLC